MTISEIMRKIAKERKMTSVKLAQIMGKKQQSVSRSMRNDNAEIGFYIECADIMGYEIVIQPKSGGKRKEGSYVLAVNDSGRNEEEMIRLAKERELYELECKAAEIRKDLRK